jgi:thymidylate kinase
MKAEAVSIVLAALAFSILSPAFGIVLASVLMLSFATRGGVNGAARENPHFGSLSYVFPLFLAPVGGSLWSTDGRFLLPAAYAASVVTSAVPNGKRQGGVFAASRERGGGTVALLGIDGSGKSSHSEPVRQWFERRGYRCSTVQFHKYIFADNFVRKPKADLVLKGMRGRGNPLRPVVSLADNLILYTLTAFGVGFRGEVVVYDRFIYSTYVKYKALGYPVVPLSKLYLLPKPTFAVVLDIPVSRSLEVIRSRPTHIRYQQDVLSQEREEYLRIASANMYPVIDSTASFSDVQAEIEQQLSRWFPSRSSCSS